jgi:acyl carrier protein
VDDIQNRLSKCFLTTFRGLRAADIPGASPETVPEWDSVAHLTLLAVVSEEFGVELDLEEFQEKASFDSIQAQLRSMMQHG